MFLTSFIKQCVVVGTVSAAILGSSLAVAGPLVVDLADVSGSLSDGFEIGVPDLNPTQRLGLQYTGPINAQYDGYSDTRTFFTGGPNFVLGAGSSITIFGVNFRLGSAAFEIWDLDTVSATETVTFSPGDTLLTGATSNIPNNEAHLPGNTLSSGTIASNEAGRIIITAGQQGAAFAIGGIAVNPVPAPTPLLLIGLGLLALRFRR